MIESPSRRFTLARIGGALAALTTVAMTGQAQAEEARPAGTGKLARLTQQLRMAPRKRQFKSVPFMLTDPADWDDQAARLVLGYADRSKQVWENTEISAGWPTLMREAMNGEVFSHRNPDFLQVSATHGLAHLALFSDDAWSRYQLDRLAGSPFTSNSLIREKAGVGASDDLQDIEGFYGPNNNNIVSLQKRGAVFIACHDSIFAIARKLQLADLAHAGPANKSTGEIAADLTNNLIPDCVLVPSVVAILVELQKVGFTYVKGS